MALERELKFRVAPRTTRRLAQALALGPAQRLSSIYFDTPRHELRGARVALRLRRAGRRFLQTVKCELAPLERGEWETQAPGGHLDLARLPLTEIHEASGVDIAALAARLKPRFETRFARRTAELRFERATIEAALDRGALIAAGRREPILELELELKKGEPRALLTYARSLVEPFRLQLVLESKAERGYRLAQGTQAAPPRKWRRPELADATPAAALGQLVGAALVQAAANAPGVLDCDDGEYLHQLRVALRRLRVTLIAFRALKPRAKSVKRRLRAFSPSLGAARDWDVFAASLPKASAIARRARKRQMQARRTARAVVASARFNDFLLRGFEWVERAPWKDSSEPLAAFAAQSLERLHAKAVKLAEGIDWQAAAERHALRIRVKRLRYACDSLAACFAPAALEPYLAAIEALQDDLGGLNDIAVAHRLSAELTGNAALKRRLLARERRLIGRLSRDWAAFAERWPFWRSGS
jgi:inorganic triphosphatase YgiF